MYTSGMPYLFRNTDTELWRAFKARAATEGRSLRWLLEELIRRYVKHGLVLFCVIAAGCNGIEPNPTSPTPVTGPVTPTAIQIVVMPGQLPIGGGTADLSIATVAGNGTLVAPGVPVRLRVDGGELSTANVTTDATGHARVTWTGTRGTTVTAEAGQLSASTLIVVAGLFVPPPDVPPVPLPQPPPPAPLPPQPTPQPALEVTLTPAPRQVLVGQPTTLTAAVSNLGPGEVVLAYQWDWDAGTVFTADETSAGNSRQHIYTVDGVKAPQVLVRTSTGRTTSATTSVFVVSP